MDVRKLSTISRLCCAITLVALWLLAACSVGSNEPPPRSSTLVPTITVQELTVLRRRTETADRTVRLRRADLERYCPWGKPVEPGNEAMCQVTNPGRETLQGNIIEAANRCGKLAALYNEAASRLAPGAERIVLGQTDNEQYGGTITCSPL